LLLSQILVLATKWTTTNATELNQSCNNQSSEYVQNTAILRLHLFSDFSIFCRLQYRKSNLLQLQLHSESKSLLFAYLWYFNL